MCNPCKGVVDFSPNTSDNNSFANEDITMITMTKSDFIQRYGHIKVKFSNYLKYEFTFTGITDDGNLIEVQCGGNIDDMYRLQVVSNYEERIQDLNPFLGYVYGRDSIGYSVPIASFYEN
jgi:hypothetical protein